MISAFIVRPVAIGRGLCDIDRFRVTQSHVKKLGCPGKTQTMGIFWSCQDFLIF